MRTRCSATLAIGPLETHRVRELEVGLFERRGARDGLAFGNSVFGVVHAERTLYASSRRLGHHVRDHVSCTERLEDGRSRGGHGVVSVTLGLVCMRVSSGGMTRVLP